MQKGAAPPLKIAVKCGKGRRGNKHIALSQSSCSVFDDLYRDTETVSSNDDLYLE